MKFTEWIDKELINEGINDKGTFKCLFLAGSSACFDRDTLIKTIDGYKKIKDIVQGDRVLTFNESSKEKEWKEVNDVLVKNVDVDILEIEFESGEKVICTEDHKFFINGEWIEAKYL